jgi:hypothetical protein
MPEKKTVARARKAKKTGKSASTQAGSFVHEEIEHVKKGRHGAASSKQAIAIGLSKARRSGVKVKPPAKGKASAATRKKAERDTKTGTAKRSSAKAASHRAASKKRKPAKKTASSRRKSASSRR